MMGTKCVLTFPRAEIYTHRTGALGSGAAWSGQTPNINRRSLLCPSLSFFLSFFLSLCLSVLISSHFHSPSFSSLTTFQVFFYSVGFSHPLKLRKIKERQNNLLPNKSPL